MKVLVGADGSAAAGAATRLLGLLARPAEFRVLTVASFDLALELTAHTGRYDEAAALEHARSLSEAAARELEAAGHRATGLVADGHPETEILRVAAEEGADLVAVGAGRERWLDILLLGSTSRGIVIHSPVPVLVVHRFEPADREHLRVLAATDGSEHAERAARCFSELADPARCSVLAVAVGAPGATEVGPRAKGTDALTPEGGASAAERLARLLEDAGFRVDTAVRSGSPAPTLLQEASAAGCDLVVVGSRGLGGARRLLGSVSDRIARHAPATLVGR